MLGQCSCIDYVQLRCNLCARTPCVQDYLDQVQGRSKEKRYTFDVAYDTQVGAPSATLVGGL